MTLNQILYFRKVARLENYHQAAEELYISQPSLSRSMAALESELGITLFEKKGRGVVLTNAGRLFLEHADRIAGDCDIAAGGTVIHAKGTGTENAQQFLGVTLVPEKEMLFIVVKSEQKNSIMRAIMEKAGLESKAQSIVFSLPVTDTAGMRLMEEMGET